MPKFTLICEHHPGYTITHEFDDEYLPDVLDNIELFLRGCGFVNDGTLDFVSDGDFRQSELREHADCYYDFDRNQPIK